MDTSHTSVNLLSPEKIEELQRIEAEWVTRELEEFVKLIQRYRSLYRILQLCFASFLS